MHFRFAELIALLITSRFLLVNFSFGGIARVYAEECVASDWTNHVISWMGTFGELECLDTRDNHSDQLLKRLLRLLKDSSPHAIMFEHCETVFGSLDVQVRSVSTESF